MSRHCGTGHVLPLRPELQAAYDEMNAQRVDFAYAVCRTYDGQAWKVNTKEKYIYSALDSRYANRDEAISAGIAWVSDFEVQ